MMPVPPASFSRPLRCRDRQIVVGGGPLMVGIVNITPDSFFDGGRFASPEAAMAQAERLVSEGAAMIDVGGQSTRPNFEEISPEEEISRVVPLVAALSSRLAVPVSVDTYKPQVARAALAAGAHVLNDIYGFQRDPELAQVAAEFSCAVILMHQDAGFRHAPGDTLEKMTAFFSRSLEIAARAGVSRDRLVLDPGIGFGKTQAQNLEVLARLSELKTLGCPLFLGASRKSFIGNVLDLAIDERLEGTLATTALAVWQGVDFIRVHDVRANLRAAKMARAVRDSFPT